MAKTRIKTTPTRMQKDALMASATTAVVVATPTTATATATATCHSGATLDAGTKRLRHTTVPVKSSLSGPSTIIVAAPKRTNSISSVASSISQTSDAQYPHSDTESPPPQPLLNATATTSKPLLTATQQASTQAPRTLNSLLCKPSNAIAALRNRKVFMITEKCDESAGVQSSTSAAGGTAAGQKRKMYLIMEENSFAGAESAEGGNVVNDAQKYLKSENGLIFAAGGTKKLTLFADKTDSGVLTQKFEKILPEILNRIQAKDASARPMLAATTTKLLNSSVNLNIVKEEPMQQQQQQQQQQQPQQQYYKQEAEENNERLPITLPPKKNRTKIITTNTNNTLHNSAPHNKTTYNNNMANIFSNSAANIINLNNKVDPQCHIKQSSAATPVIVSAVTLSAGSEDSANNNNNNNSSSGIKHHAAGGCSNNGNNSHTNIKYASNCNGQAVSVTPVGMSPVSAIPHKNINLSTDFLFLMKMLPKLESIPEPHKNNVKNCIEKIITQNANVNAIQ